MIKKHQILMQLFNFQYAGLINIHICTNKKGYLVVSHGFEINTKGQLFLSKKKYVRKLHEDLQSAILTYCYLVREVCAAFDFFKQNYFDSEEFKKETILDVYKT